MASRGLTSERVQLDSFVQLGSSLIVAQSRRRRCVGFSPVFAVANLGSEVLGRLLAGNCLRILVAAQEENAHVRSKSEGPPPPQPDARRRLHVRTPCLRDAAGRALVTDWTASPSQSRIRPAATGKCDGKAVALSPNMRQRQTVDAFGCFRGGDVKWGKSPLEHASQVFRVDARSRHFSYDWWNHSS
jgi:hypothetical protein